MIRQVENLAGSRARRLLSARAHAEHRAAHGQVADRRIVVTRRRRTASRVSRAPRRRTLRGTRAL